MRADGAINRITKALFFGVAVSIAQAVTFFGAAIASGLGFVVSPWLGVPIAFVAMPLALGGAPLLVHEALQRTRWRPSGTLLSTILSSIGGVALGHLVGAVFLETGHMRGGQLLRAA